MDCVTTLPFDFRHVSGLHILCNKGCQIVDDEEELEAVACSASSDDDNSQNEAAEDDNEDKQNLSGGINYRFYSQVLVLLLVGSVGEIIFAIFISVFGLVLFASLIANMQKYLQSTSVRVEEMRVKRRDAEQWMSHHMLPDLLKERIRRYEQYLYV
ncbi:putative cyclic nucleotide-gated ion channel 3 [Glycine max]|nr:putative cyclic nucleotide-gated ion channel 3 [Glycine max]